MIETIIPIPLTVARSCPAGSFQCSDETGCADYSQVCDEQADCADGSDEAPDVCSARICHTLEHRCDSGQCIIPGKAKVCAQNPVNMPVGASTRPVLVRCWQHRPSTGPVLAHNGAMFMGNVLVSRLPTDRSIVLIMELLHWL